MRGATSHIHALGRTLDGLCMHDIIILWQHSFFICSLVYTLSDIAIILPGMFVHFEIISLLVTCISTKYPIGILLIKVKKITKVRVISQPEIAVIT